MKSTDSNNEKYIGITTNSDSALIWSENLMEIKGKFNSAICYANVIEESAIEQIRRMCDYDFTEGAKIRIMPDVHAGKGCTIGTTMTIKDKVVPNIVGVDIGCGMYTVELEKLILILSSLTKLLISYRVVTLFGRVELSDSI